MKDVDLIIDISMNTFIHIYLDTLEVLDCTIKKY